MTNLFFSKNSTVATLVTLLLLTMTVSFGANAQKPKKKPAEAPAPVETPVVPDGPPPPLQLGIVLDGDDAIFKDAAKNLAGEIAGLAGDTRQVVLDEKNLVSADHTVSGVSAALTEMLSRPGVDMVIAFGSIASDLAVKIPEPSRPLIAPFVLDAVLQKAPHTAKGTSGVKNLTYLLYAPSYVESMTAFVDAVGADQVTVVTDEMLAGVSIAQQDATLEKMLGKSAVKLTVIDKADAALIEKNTAPGGAVFLFPNPQIEGDARKTLFNTLADKGFRVFSWRAAMDVDNGALLSFTPKIDLLRINRRLAIAITNALEGSDSAKSAGDLEVGFVEAGQLSVNMAVATRVKYEPPRAVLVNGRLVGAGPGTAGAPLTLKAAVAEALQNNLSWLASQAEVEAGKQNLWQAWTRYFPSLFVRGNYSLLDEETARIMSATESQQSIRGQLGFVQMILDHKVIGDIAVQSALNDQRKAALEQARLDITLTAASAWLDVQLAMANAEIIRQNLQVTQYNLSMARRKAAVGLSGPAEVYRWESEEATGMQDLIVFETRLEAARFALNRVLRREIDSPIILADADMTAGDSATTDARWSEVLSKESSYTAFKQFIADKGLETSPELAQYVAAMKAKKHEQGTNTAGYLVPSLAVEGTLSNKFWSDAADGAATPYSLPDQSGLLQVVMNWDIFDGGTRIAGHKKARMEGKALGYQKEDMVLSLREHIYKSISNIVGSSEAVRLSTISSNAAHRNLDIASEAYGLGTLTLERLVDAQRQAFNADQDLASARFQLRIDELNLMRAINKIDVYMQGEKPGQQLIDEFEKSQKQ